MLPEKERTILLEIDGNPGRLSDTFYFTDILHFPGRADIGTVRMTPEYAPPFKETLRIIESLVEKGLIDGKQLNHVTLGMYYSDLKIKYKGRQAAIREKRHAEELAKVPILLDSVNAIKKNRDR